MSDRCPVCRDLGWTLVGDADRVPLLLDYLPCPEPGCPHAGRPVEALGLFGAFGKAALHPTTRAVVSVTGARTPDHDPIGKRPPVSPARVPSPSTLPPGSHPTGTAGR